MRKSDIFENFIKIAEEKGMISKDAPEKAIKKLEQNPRMDSLSVEEIAKLYNIKPDSPKDMDYKNNIMEIAHPDPTVVAPSYDRLNGLVENNIERQNILLHIVNKNPDGLLTNHKYAEKELLLSLIRVANNLDNRNEDKLRILADTCLTQIAGPQLKKEALAPLALAGIWGIPAILGSLYLQQHLDFVNDGFVRNHQKLVAELDDLLTSNSNWGVGYQYNQEFINMVQDFKNKLESFFNLYSKFEPIITDIEKPRSAKELLELATKPETAEVIDAYKKLRAAFDDMLPYVTTVQKNFSNEGYKNRQIQEKGFFSSLIDSTQVLHGGKGLVADDFDDVSRAIDPYLKSLQEIMEVLKNAESLQDKSRRDLEMAATKSQELLGSEDNSKAPVMPASRDFDKEVLDLEKELSTLV